MDEITHQATSRQEDILLEGPTLSGTKLFVTLTGQLLQGCGESRCTQVHCRTSRVRSCQSHGTVFRDYDVKAARGIAVTLCLRPDPLSYVCHYYRLRSLDNTETRPLDPSSLTQQLSNAPSMRNLGTYLPPPAPTDFAIKFKQHQTSLRRLIREYRDTSDVGRDTGKILFNCVSWLLEQVPLLRQRPWHFVSKYIVNEGLSSPKQPLSFEDSDDTSTCTEILDRLNDERLNNFLHDIVIVFGFSRGRCRTSPWHDPKYHIHVPSLPTLIIGQYGENAVFALIVWLKKLFVTHWKRSIMVDRQSAEGASLSLVWYLVVAWVYERDEFPYKLGLAWSNTEDTDITSTDSTYEHAGFGIADIMRAPFSLGPTEIALAAKNLLDDLDLILPTDAGDHRLSVLTSFGLTYHMDQKTDIFRAVNHLRMRRAHSNAEKAVRLRDTRHRNHPATYQYIAESSYLETQYLVLNVSRSNIIRDTFDRLWQRRKGELLLPLRVRFGQSDAAEMGQDLGGVQIEFFNLICQELFSAQSGMFTTDLDTGFSYFRQGSLQPLHMFEMCGILFALALYNGIPLPIDMNPAFYFVLTGMQEWTADHKLWPEFSRGWPLEAQGMKHALNEDVLKHAERDYSFTMEANGLRLEVLKSKHVEGSDRTTLEILDHTATDGPTRAVPPLDQISFPGWNMVKATREAPLLTKENIDDYFVDYIRWMTHDAVAPQWAAFMTGFYSHGIIRRKLLQACFNHCELRALLEGAKTVNIEKLRILTKYEEYETSSEHIAWFWQILRSWPEEKQRKLFKFVTSFDRTPLNSPVSFTIRRWDPGSLEHLPRSSTCFRTLELPPYPSLEIMEQKLSCAVEYGSQGFGIA